jgi:hypothetical protein
MNKNHPRHGREYDQIRRLIYEAINIWQENSKLKLREVREDTADILIDFASGNHGDNFDFQGPGGSLGKMQPLFSYRMSGILIKFSTSQHMHFTRALDWEVTFTWITMRAGTLKPALMVM